MAKQTVAIDVEVTGEQAAATINAIKKEAKEATAEVKKVGDEGSKSMDKLATSIKKADNQYDKLNSVQRAESILKVSEGIAGGFAAVQGVMGLVGGESEELTKALLKVQSALAISQGIKSVTEGIHNMGAAFDTVKKVVLGNPLVAVGAALFAGAIAGLIALTQRESEYEKAVNASKAANEAVIAALDTRMRIATQGLDDEIALLKAAGKETFEQERKKQQIIQETAIGKLSSLKRTRDIEKANFDEQIQEYKELGGAWETMANIVIEKSKDKDSTIFKSRKETDDKIAAYEKELHDSTLALKVLEVTEDKKQDDAKLKNYQAYLDKKHKLEVDRRKEDIDALNETNKQIQDKVDDNNEKIRIGTEDNVIAPIRKLPDITNQAVDDSISAFDRFSAASSRLSEFLNGKFSDVSNGITGALGNALNAASSLYANAEAKQLKAAEGNEAAQEQIKKKFFERNKKVQLAQARIAMFTSAIEAYKSTVGIPVVGPIVAPINAAAALIAGKMNIENIKRQEYASGSDSASAPSVNAPAIPDSLSNNAPPQNNTTNINPDGSVNNGPGVIKKTPQEQTIKAVVLASEVEQVNNQNNKLLKIGSV